MITDNYILEHCLRTDGLINKNKITEEVHNYLILRFNDIPVNLYSDAEVVTRIKLKIDKRPVCEICGSPVKYLNRQKTPFATFCSKKCVGLKNVTLLHNRWSNMTEEEKLSIADKTKQTCLERYGVEYSFQSDNNKEKSKLTCLKKYGEEHYGTYGSKTFKQNMIDKYGYEFPLTSDIVRNKISKALSSDETQEKLKQTNLEKYGVEYVSQNKEVKAKIIHSYNKNKSGNTSKQEKLLYDILLSIYPNTVHFYTSDLYPYNCDFYIPELLLYIEYHGALYHNKHMFRENNTDDLKYLLMLIDTGYDESVKTWSLSDIEKYNTAKRNNINYLVIYPEFYKKWRTYCHNKKMTDEYRSVIKEEITELLRNIIDDNYIGKYNIQKIIGENIKTK